MKAFLVPRTRRAGSRSWPVPLPERGLWKVTGQAGAGVSSFLVDVAVNAITADPARAAEQGVLIVASSKESGARLRAELSERLAATGFLTHEPVVRSVHSLAFALLRQRVDEEIRLISGAEQDAVIRELLAGHAADGGGTWPDELRPALPMVGFGRQLRDFLLRAVERGLGWEDLVRLGEEHDIAIWSAAGEFLREYRQVMRLAGARRYSASELVAEVLREELTARWGVVLVDDAQHLAPASAELVKHLLQRAELGVVGGDVEQAVFRFRGASPAFFASLGGLEHDVIDLGASPRQPSCEVVVAPDAQTHAAVVVDTLRRAHFEDGTPYGRMAVVVRATPMIEPLRRALLQGGVPVTLDPTDVVLAEQRIVVALLLGLRALEDPAGLSSGEWREFLLGPVGGADPVTLRRLLRGLRRWAPEQPAEDTLRELLAAPGALPEFGSVLTDREVGILTRVRSVLDAGREAMGSGGSVEEVLWAVWESTGLAQRLLDAALRGGAGGSQADRDLDAAMALFDAAGDFTERRATAGVGAFVDYIAAQELPTGVRDRRTAKPDAVALVTAHGAAGREFERVVVAGVQELSWPSLGETGTIFRQEDLIDLVDADVDPAVPVSHTRERLVEERRLFHVAVTRATGHLLVTAVDDQEGDEVVQPSRFVEEFCATFGVEPRVVKPSHVRVLARDEVVAELRRAVSGGAGVVERANGAGEAGGEQVQAARQLARLADAGVAGAAPEEWWGVLGTSTDEALPVRSRLSPSRIEALLACPMRAVLERMVGLDETLAMVHGSMAHAYLEALGRGVDPAAAHDAVMAARREAQQGPSWKAARDLADFEEMLARIDGWLASSRSAFEQVGVEVDVDVEVEAGLRVAGRIDRLERDRSGALHIVDLKTGSQPPTVQATEENPQLAAYQLALSRDGAEVGGAVLVYPNAAKTRLATREQAPKSADDLEAFAQLIRGLPEAMAGPELTARTGPHCEQCLVRALCPVQPEGRRLTDA